LFGAIVRQILGWPKPAKAVGLRAFADAGYLLIDATYTPIDEGCRKPERYREAAAKGDAKAQVGLGARAQVQLIDDLLDLSRIMTGKIRLDLRQVSFGSVVEAAVESAMPSAEAKGIRTRSWARMRASAGDSTLRS